MKYILLLILVSMTLLGCTQTQQNDSDFIVGVTFYPYYDLTRHIVGEVAEVFSVVPPTTEPHSFQPSARDIARLQNIDVFVATGVEFEAFEQSLINSLPSSVIVIFASEGITLLDSDHHHDDHYDDHHELEEFCEANGGVWIEDHKECENLSRSLCESMGGEFESCESACRHDADDVVCMTVCVEVCEFDHHDEHHESEHSDGHGHSHTGLDPHVWLSPQNAIHIAQNIERVLSSEFLEHSSTFAANLDLLISELTELHIDFETRLSNCARDTILVTHNAYQYLARDYGFNVVSISGLSPESEPSPRELAQLIDIAREKELSYVFFEELVDPRVAQTIAREVGAQTLTINPVEGSIEGQTYIEIMRENLNNLAIGLECE